mmetsp:Transcript_551/g.866  ORF Transcript_551/g.866 Transcript_551/m.866 type:complete len:284 (+) Transcript_551:158-1009(+)
MNRRRTYQDAFQDGMGHMSGHADPSRAQVNPAMQTTAKRGRTPGTKVIKTCRSCNKEIAAALTKCPECGDIFRQKKEKGTRSGKRGRKLCPSCNHENPAAAASCKSCGFKFRMKISERFGKGMPVRSQQAVAARRRQMGQAGMMNGPGMAQQNRGMAGYGNMGTGMEQGGMMAGANYSMGGAPGANIGANPGINSYGVQGMRGHSGYGGIASGQVGAGMHGMNSMPGSAGQVMPGPGVGMGGSIGGLAGIGGVQQLPSYSRGGGNEQEQMHGVGQQPPRYHGI